MVRAERAGEAATAATAALLVTVAIAAAPAAVLVMAAKAAAPAKLSERLAAVEGMEALLEASPRAAVHGPRPPPEMHSPPPLSPALAPAWLLRRSEREEVSVAIRRFCIWAGVTLAEGFESEVCTVIVVLHACEYDCSAEKQRKEHWGELTREHGPRDETTISKGNLWVHQGDGAGRLLRAIMGPMNVPLCARAVG